MHSFQKILRTNDMNDFQKCGEILVAAKYNIFALTCDYCQTKFTLYQAFIRHLQRQHCNELKFGNREKDIEVCVVEELMTTVQQTTVEDNVSKESGWTEDDENWLTVDDKKWLDEGIEEKDIEKDKLKHNKSILKALEDCDVTSNLLDNLNTTNCGEKEDNMLSNTILRQIQNDWNYSDEDEEYPDKNISEVEEDILYDFDGDITISDPCITSTRNEENFDNCLNSKCIVLKDLLEGLDDLQDFDGLLENLEDSLIENPIINKDPEIEKFMKNTKTIIDNDENTINLNSDLKTITLQTSLEDSIVAEPQNIVEDLELQLTNLEEHLNEETNKLFNKHFKHSDKCDKKPKEIPLKATLNDVLIKALEEALEDNLNFLNLDVEKETDSPLGQDLRDLLDQELMEEDIVSEIENEPPNKLNSITQNANKEGLTNLKATIPSNPLIYNVPHLNSNDFLNSSVENDKIGQQEFLTEQITTKPLPIKQTIEILKTQILTSANVQKYTKSNLNVLNDKTEDTFLTEPIKSKTPKKSKEKPDELNIQNIQNPNKVNPNVLEDKHEDKLSSSDSVKPKTNNVQSEDFSKLNIQKSDQLSPNGYNFENKLLSPELLISKTRKNSQEKAEDINSLNVQKNKRKKDISSPECIKAKTPKKIKENLESLMSNTKLRKTSVEENPETDLTKSSKKILYAHKFTPHSIFINTERGNKTPLKQDEIFLKQSLEIQDHKDNSLKNFTPPKDEKTLKIKEQMFLEQIEKIQGRNEAPTSDIMTIRKESTSKTRRPKALKQNFKPPEVKAAPNKTQQTLGKPNLRSAKRDKKEFDLKRNKLNFTTIKPKLEKQTFPPTQKSLKDNTEISPKIIHPGLKNFVIKLQRLTPDKLRKISISKTKTISIDSDSFSNQLNNDPTKLFKLGTKVNKKVFPLNTEKKDLIKSSKGVVKAKYLCPENKDTTKSLKSIKKAKEKQSTLTAENKDLTEFKNISKNANEKDHLLKLKKIVLTKSSKTNTNLIEKDSPSNLKNKDTTKCPKTKTKAKENSSPSNREKMKLTKSSKHSENIHNIPTKNVKPKISATRRTTRKASIDVLPNQNKFNTKSSSTKTILKHSNLNYESYAINRSARKKEILHRMPYIRKHVNFEEINMAKNKNIKNVNVSRLPHLPEVMNGSTNLSNNLQKPLPNTAAFTPTIALSTKNLNIDVKQSKTTIETPALGDEGLIKSLKRSATSPLIGDGKLVKRPHTSLFKDDNTSDKALIESNENNRVIKEVMESSNVDSSDILDDLLQQVANEYKMNEKMDTPKTEVADKNTKPAGFVNDFDDTKDLDLVSKFGLNIIKSPNIENVITFEEIDKMHDKAKKFAEIYKNYKIIYTSKNIANANNKFELAESIHQFLMQINQMFNSELTLIDIRRLINLITFWYAQNWNRKIVDKDKNCDGTGRYLLMFHYLPRDRRRRLYYCEYCNEHFNADHYYFTHRAIHTENQSPFKCSICLLGFKFLKNLKLHEQDCVIKVNSSMLPENVVNTPAQLKKPLLKYSYSPLKRTTNYLLNEHT